MRAEDLHETWPEIPEWVDRRELGADVLADLRSLSKAGADFVAGHLVAAGALADDEPEQAWLHARAARSQGGRVAVVRETVGLVAYRAGEWAQAVAELRAARRMGGGPGHLAVLADCERALGNPERAIELSRSTEATELDPAAAAELAIVVAGARSDLGQLDVALASLSSTLERSDPDAGYWARLAYAYADLLEQAGRTDEALTWFIKAADADGDEETDAAERIDALTGDGALTGEDDDESAAGAVGDDIDEESGLAEADGDGDGDIDDEPEVVDDGDSDLDDEAADDAEDDSDAWGPLHEDRDEADDATPEDPE